jgi:hypothetical protein
VTVVVVTVILAVAVVVALLRTGDPKALPANAPLIAAVAALGVSPQLRRSVLRLPTKAHKSMRCSITSSRWES